MPSTIGRLSTRPPNPEPPSLASPPSPAAGASASSFDILSFTLPAMSIIFFAKGLSVFSPNASKSIGKDLNKLPMELMTLPTTLNLGGTNGLSMHRLSAITSSNSQSRWHKSQEHFQIFPPMLPLHLPHE